MQGRIQNRSATIKEAPINIGQRRTAGQQHSQCELVLAAFKAATDGRHRNRTADEDGFRPQGQHVKDIHPGTDSATHEDVDLIAHSTGKWKARFRPCRAVLENPAARIGHHNGVNARINGAVGGFGSHAPLNLQLVPSFMHKTG